MREPGMRMRVVLGLGFACTYKVTTGQLPRVTRIYLQNSLKTIEGLKSRSNSQFCVQLPILITRGACSRCSCVRRVH